ncbi:hypothetical protein [Dyella silvae]|uniref:hypothetical protein n=1 Tax=Dyella silvae TaxID=2994424 RepID=UPI00226412C9|nr:hypothetical protein [Dyella silvae]
MSSRRCHSPFAVFLACLFGLLLLVGTPVRSVQASAASFEDKAVATQVMSDDVADAATDHGGDCSLDDNTGNNGMDDILHPFDVAYLWAPMPSVAPVAGSYDVGPHDPARLLRPPESI